MKRAGALGLVGVVFLVGLAGGALGGRLFDNPHPRHPDLGGPPPFQRYFMQDDLDLTSEQEEKLAEVFRRQHEKFEELHSDLRPRVEALMEETHAQLEEILSPEQLERYRSRGHHRRRHSRSPRHRGRAPEGPPGDTAPRSVPPPVD